MNINEIINKSFYYEGDDLGYNFINGNHVFKVWTPISEKVQLCIYEDFDSKECTKYEMRKSEVGVFEIQLQEDLNNKYYTFLAKINEEYREAQDPYSKALSVNGEKSAIINIEETNPEGFENHSPVRLDSFNDSIIYEVHTRDLSIDSDSGIKNKGKFLGFTEENTTGVNGIKTGLSHIKDLGVTHIQLLPIYDFGSVDESLEGAKNQTENSIPYNWGYDPMNYNAPDGTYSTDAFNPKSRIKELKMAIQSIHKNGMGVIMDVVYNHMYDVDKSSFNKLMPGYYFRYNEDGTLRDETGCGNVIASENPMVRRYIVDSVKYWAKEYKLDGFRFDLMGLIDVETMNEIRRELDKIDKRIIMIGEGWNMGYTLKDEDKAIQPNAGKLKGISFFNDETRDGLRGSAFDNPSNGFLLGADNNEIRVKRGIVGAIDYSDEIRTWGNVEPYQSINYVECHDNHTLFDKINEVIKDEKIIKEASRLGATITLLAQGVPFIHAGQEFFRTKNGVENSYNANDTINKINWSRKSEELDTVEYFKGLIKLRKEHPAFRMETVEQIRENLRFIESPKKTVAYTISNVESDSFKKILVIHNANYETVEVNLESSQEWNIIVNKNNSGTEILETIEGKAINVEALSTIVAYV